MSSQNILLNRILTTALLLAIFLIAPTAGATTATGTIAVTATTVASVSLTFVTDGAGITLGGTASAATMSFGTLGAYTGAPPTGVTRVVTAPTNWSLSTPFDVLVYVANQTSANYTLTGALAAADATNTWTIGATALTTTAQTLTATGAYGPGTTAFTFKLTIPFTEAAGAIANTINFVATAN